MFTDPSGESFILAIGIGFLVGAFIGAGFEIAAQIKVSGSDISQWNWGQIGLSALGGGVAGAISAIPIGGFGFLSYMGTFSLGGVASVTGGLISGNVSFSDPTSIALAFTIGGFANVIARGISSKINKIISNKAQNTLQNSMAFKNMNLHDLIGTGVKGSNINSAYLRLTNEAIQLSALARGSFSQSGVYSLINSNISNLLSGWY